MMKQRRSGTERHLTRKELLSAAREEQAPTGHLSRCAECLESVSLLRSFQMAGRTPLPEPPKAWIDRAAKISESSWRSRILAQVKGVITFDSWLQPFPVGVRGQASSIERRVCCEAGPYLVDLRAEKHSDGWRMVAQLSGENAETARLIDGSQIIPADRDAIFQWSATRPPSTLSIEIGDKSILFPKLSWKRPRKT